MFQNITKKVILSLILWLFVWIGIFISYATNIINLSSWDVSTWDIINNTWFNNVRARLANITDTWIYTWSINPANILAWTAWINIIGNATTATNSTTATLNDNDTSIATTQFVNSEIANDAPTKIGGWASGTWWINITGNAATASGVPWTWVTWKPTIVSAFTNDAWYITSTTDNRVNTSWDTMIGQLFLNNSGPTIYFQDTDNRSAMIHTNSNNFYILRWDWTNSTVYTATLWRRPLVINLENNNATFWWDVYANAFMYNSDKNLKYNIKTLENAKDILKIDAVRFDWRRDWKKDIWIIAQEVEKYFPEFVEIDERWYKSVNYPKLVVPLIKVVKKQQEKIDDLEKRLKILEEKIK